MGGTGAADATDAGASTEGVAGRAARGAAVGGVRCPPPSPAACGRKVCRRSKVIVKPVCSSGASGNSCRPCTAIW